MAREDHDLISLYLPKDVVVRINSRRFEAMGKEKVRNIGMSTYIHRLIIQSLNALDAEEKS